MAEKKKTHKKSTKQKVEDELKVVKSGEKLEESDLTKEEFDWLKRILVGATTQLKDASRENRLVTIRLEKSEEYLQKTCKKSNELLFSLTQKYKELSKKLEDFEESLMFIMHNIKKNQFLYAHYPDDWVKEYLDVKEGMKFENKRLDKKTKTAS